MSYAHMTYGVDLGRLKALWGSKDEALLEEILDAQADELDSNDEFFEDMRDDDEDEEDEDEGGDEGGAFPDSRTALREIVAGSIAEREGAEAVYGYVLKILCEHLGEFLDGDIAEISQHPYESRMISNGSPLPIPIDHGDFPEVYHLPLEQIPEEIRRIDEAIAAGAKPRPDVTWKAMDSDELIEDMQVYRDVLVQAQTCGLSLVSFRH